MLQMQPWNKNTPLRKMESLYPIQRMQVLLQFIITINVYSKNNKKLLFFIVSNMQSWLLVIIPNMDMTPQSAHTTRDRWMDPVLSKSPVGDTKIPDPVTNE